MPPGGRVEVVWGMRSRPAALGYTVAAGSSPPSTPPRVAAQNDDVEKKPGSLNVGEGDEATMSSKQVTIAGEEAADMFYRRCE